MSNGRPRGVESERRRKEFVRLVLVEELSVADAARLSRIKAERALVILDEPTFRSAWLAVRNGDCGPIAVAA